MRAGFDKSMVEAIKQSRVDEVKARLEKGDDPNHIDPENGYSYLHYAVEIGVPDVVEQLLKFGAHVDDTDAEGITPLMKSAAMGNTAIVQLLMDKGADPTIQDSESGSVIDYALANGHINLAMKLDAYIDKHMQNAKQQSDTSSYPLQPETLRESTPSSDGPPPLLSAVVEGDLDQVQKLIAVGKKETLNQLDSENQNLLHHAIYAIDDNPHDKALIAKIEASMGLLIDHGTKVDQGDIEGMTPLMNAARFGQLSTVNLLLAKNANPRQKNQFGKTALDYAEQKQHADIVSAMKNTLQKKSEKKTDVSPHLASHLKAYEKLEALIKEKEATIHFNDVHGYTLLHYAAAMGDIAKMEECFAKGADLNHSSAFNHASPIEMAIENDQLEAAQWLYEHGADCSDVRFSICESESMRDWFSQLIKEAIREAIPSASNDVYKENQFFKMEGIPDESKPKGKSRSRFISPSTRAAEIGDLDFIKKFKTRSTIQAEQFRRETLNVAAENNNMHIIQFLLDNGTRPSDVRPYSQTPLHAAIANHQVDTVDFLIRNGFDINIQNSRKNTPLMTAVLMNNKSICDRLWQEKVDLTLRNIDGENILHCAARSGNQDLLSKLLLEKDPVLLSLLEQKDIYGRMPIDTAIQRGNDQIILLLAPLSPRFASMSLEDIKSLPEYGHVPTNTQQEAVMKKMYYFLHSQERDTSFFNITGGCNGFGFLEQYYDEKAMGDYYYDTLALMSSWDGSESELDKSLADRPQGKFYNNLRELFDQWINDVMWFQQAPEVAELATGRKGVDTQHDKLMQWRIIGGDESRAPVRLYSEKGVMNKEKLAELLHYFSRMPQGTRVEISGTGHATNGSRSQEGLSYYDPSTYYKLPPMRHDSEMLNVIIDYKYIAFTRQWSDEFHVGFNLFYFNNPAYKAALDHFNVFAGEMPKTKEDALHFQDHSPNGFTPLHVAVLTHSTPALYELLLSNCCDLHAKDNNGKTALESALMNGYDEGCKLILSAMRDNKDPYLQSTRGQQLVERFLPSEAVIQDDSIKRSLETSDHHTKYGLGLFAHSHPVEADESKLKVDVTVFPKKNS